jgi:hypothetical protein
MRRGREEGRRGALKEAVVGTWLLCPTVTLATGRRFFDQVLVEEQRFRMGAVSMAVITAVMEEAMDAVTITGAGVAVC